MERINIRTSCELQHLGLIGMAINGICQRFSEDVGWKIELSVVEAITNVIKYACQHCPDAPVDLNLTLDNDQLIIIISDHGKPMEIAKFKAGQCLNLDFDTSNISDLPENGRGIGLMYNLMDEVDYQSNNGINQLTLTKRVSSPSPDTEL